MMEFLKILLLTVAFITAKGQLSIDKTSIEDGGTYTMTCEARGLSTSNTNYIKTLSLDRVTGAVTSPIATYNPFPPPDLPNTKNNTGGRKWDIQFLGGVGTTTASNNKATIKIILVVSDGMCSDAGTYRCVASFDSTNAEDRKNITAQAKVEDLKIISSRHIGNDLDYSLNELGDNITLTCSVLGPPNLNLSWLYGPRDAFNFDVYPTQNDITGTSAPTGGACNQYRHESALKLKLERDNIMYICVVKVNNQQEVSRANFTIGIHETATDPGTGGSGDPASADTNVGPIVGGVIGGLVLIAIIVIVVYFCWYRKRSDDYSERDKEVESTNATHAPPPVFYAEPKKAKKDERDGVRPDKGFTNEALDNSYDDSKDHRGPPQYINTVDGEDLPRYEKETHRGRSNKGYEDENEKNEGHGRRHRRDRKDKEDRDDRKPPRKDYEDRDRGRHYSTDDGTDNRDPQVGFGDPNMGTSI